MRAVTTTPINRRRLAAAAPVWPAVWSIELLSALCSRSRQIETVGLKVNGNEID
jgi:hypothetical protein